METKKKEFPLKRSSSSSSFFRNPSDPSPLSDPKTHWMYDVFINFRGEDTRRNFVSHLHYALSKAGLNTFLDDENLQKGVFLKQGLFRTIEGSQIALVVFSESYTESTWCLQELEKIIECHETYGQRVLPVFYYIDPSVVRHQKGDFGIALKAAAAGKIDSEECLESTLLRWSTALTKAANFSGWDVRNYRNEAELVREIVNDILTKVDYEALFIAEFPVGLESRMQNVIRLTENQSTQVCMIGIWGMGGSGKTTLAKAIYNQIHRRRRYLDKSFIEDIRYVCETDRRGHVHLQQQLLSDVLKTKVEIRTVGMGKAMIQNRLSGKKVLILRDDVNEFSQLEDLCGNRAWFGQGTVVIITTRDLRLLNLLKVDCVYKMEEMNTNESLELFSWHAFRDAKPREDFIKLARNVVAYCGGLPLALRVLGSHLIDRNKKEWESVLSKLEEIPNDQVQQKLRISFDGLRDDKEKNIFLDVCCFFIGKDRAYVTEILNGCGLHADIGVTVLIERSLIKVEKNNKLGMHHLLRDMGREIIRESSPMEPGKRSRLWFQEDVVDVLTKNIGTEAINGLALKLHPTSRDCFETYAFEEMKKLKLLQLDHVQLTGDYGCLSKQLRWICWLGFPLKYIPSNFDLKGVIAIDLKHSNLRLLWKKIQLLPWLKFLNLSHSKYLTETPDFSKLPSLEKLILKDCPRLRKVHQSIGDLHNLLLINLKDCKSLRNLPRETYQLKSVKTLILSGCLNIDKLEEDIVQMESLTTLIAENTAVKQVPFSIVSSKSIGYISLCGYEGLSHNIFPSIIWSWMSPTINPPSCICSFSVPSSSLVSMDLQNNDLGDLAPMLSNLSNLRSVLVRCDLELPLSKHLRTILDDVYGLNFNQQKVRSIIRTPKKKSYLIGVGSYKGVFNTLSKRISQGLTTAEFCDDFLPGDNYPDWLSHMDEEHSVDFTVPEYCRIKGMALCVLYLSTPEIMAAECVTSVLIVNYSKCTIHKRDTVISFNDEDWQGIKSHLGPGDKVKIFVTFRPGLVVKKTGVYLICDESIDKETKPKKNAFVGFLKKILIVALGLFLLLSFHYLSTKRSILYSSVLPRREKL